MEKCLFCQNIIFKRCFCEKHYIVVKERIKKNLSEKNNDYEYTSHYHNLRFSIMKMYNREHIVDNLLKLISIAEAYRIKYGNADLVEKVYHFSKKIVFRMESNELKVNEEKEKILQDINSEIDFRKNWSKDYLCDDGHYVRSLSEMIIDNWLYKNNINHSYEKRCFLPKHKEVCLLCDFYIPSIDTYLEYWGKYHKNYIARKKAKQQYYKENKIKLINVEHENLKNINDYLWTQINIQKEKKNI